MARRASRVTKIAALYVVAFVLNYVLSGIPLPAFIVFSSALFVIYYLIRYLRIPDEQRPPLMEKVKEDLGSDFRAVDPAAIITARVKASWIEQYLKSVTTDVDLDVGYSFCDLQASEANRHRYERGAALDMGRFEHCTTYRGARAREDGIEALRTRMRSTGRLVIVGDRGAGKSVLMMRMVKTLVDEAESDRGNLRSVPVVLNLSSWAYDQREWRRTLLRDEGAPHEPFESWLVRQLRLKYQIVEEEARELIENDKLVLFLDGLDDLAEGGAEADAPGPPRAPGPGSRLDEVIRLFNLFVEHRGRREHQILPTRLRYVFTCRTDTFERLATKPAANGLICVHPLSDEQVIETLERNGGNTLLLELLRPRSGRRSRSGRARHQPSDDAVFAMEQARNPYILNVMMKTIEGSDDGERVARLLGDRTNFRSNLLTDYVVKRLNDRRYRPKNDPGAYRDDRKVIGWLARMAAWSKGSEFLIEALQPAEVLGTRPERAAYGALYLAAVTMFAVLVVAVPMAVSLFYEWNFHLAPECLGSPAQDWSTFPVRCRPGIEKGLVSLAWSTAALAVLIPPAFWAGSMRPALRHNAGGSARGAGGPRPVVPGVLHTAWHSGGLRLALLLGLALATLRFILIRFSYGLDLTGAVVNFAATFLACTLIFTWFTGKGLLYESMFVVNTADLYKPDGTRALYSAFAGVAAGLVFLAFVGLQYVLGSEWEDPRLVLGRALAFSLALTVSLPALFSFKPVSDRRTKTRPNHGVRQLAKNAAISFVALTSVGVVALYYGYGILGPPHAVVNAITGVCFGILALMFGLLSVIRHYAMRIVLSAGGGFPFRIASFLQYMTHVGLVRSVGGRFLFEHGILREFFADEENSAALQRLVAR